MFVECFDEYIERTSQPSDSLSGIIFGFEMSVKICELLIADSYDEGESQYIKFLKLFVDYIINMLKKHKESTLEIKLKVVELKKFIFVNFVQELIVLIARSCGAPILISVDRS